MVPALKRWAILKEPSVQTKEHEVPRIRALRFKTAVFLRRRRLVHRKHRDTLDDRCSDPFEMRANAPQLRSDKCVYEMKPAIQPGEQLVLDFIMQRKRDFRTVRPDFSELRQAHHVQISTRGLKRHLIGRLALNRQQDRPSFKAERSAKTEINRLRRGDSGFRHHNELPPIGLDARKARFALFERLIHVQGFL